MISINEISNIFKRALNNNDLLGSEYESIVFYNLSMLKEKVNIVQELFPKDTINAVAIKANPARQVLSFLASLGVGFEASSLPEIHMAVNAGVSPCNIVFDSPAKTIEELDYALDLGVHVNADSIMELARIDQILETKKSNSTF